MQEYLKGKEKSKDGGKISRENNFNNMIERKGQLDEIDGNKDALGRQGHEGT